MIQIEEKMIKFDEKQLIIMFPKDGAPPPLFSNFNYVNPILKNFLNAVCYNSWEKENLERDNITPSHQLIEDTLRSFFTHPISTENYVFLKKITIFQKIFHSKLFFFN